MKPTQQAGENVYVLDNDSYSKSLLKYVVYPRVPHPESLNQVFGSLKNFFQSKAPFLTIKMEVPSSTDNVPVANFYMGEELRHSVPMYMVCERIVQGEWDNFVATLTQDLKSKNINL